MVRYYRLINLLGFLAIFCAVGYILVGLGNPLGLFGFYLMQSPLFDPREFEGTEEEEGQEAEEGPEYGETSKIGFTAKV